VSQRDNRSTWLADTLGNPPFIVAALFLSSFFLPIMLIVGVPLAFIFRREPSEEWEMSHYRYLARTFWLALGLLVILAGLALTAFLTIGAGDEVGIPVLLVSLPVALLIVAQFGVRSVMSMARAVARQPMPNPDTLVF
jgi:uncharacterized membrane protein